MTSRRLLASFLRSSASRRSRSPFCSAPKPSPRPSPTGQFLHRFAAQYATSAAAASPTITKSESSAGHGGKITDEFTGQGAIGKGTEHYLPIHREAPAFVEQATKQQILVTGIKNLYKTSLKNISTVASPSKKSTEGLKVLVTAGPHAQKAVGIWLFVSAAWVFSMVVLGGVTRLTRSGLSMTDWKFTGSLPPLSDDERLIEFEKYKQSPEYKRINKGMDLDDFKFIYWMEYAHRMWGRALGIMFALPFSYFLRKGYITLQLALRLSGLFALGAGQGLIGWWMVKSGLEEPIAEYAEPRVSPYRLAAHLTSAFIIYIGLFWTALSVVMPEPPTESLAWVQGAAKVKRLAGPVSILVGITAVSGAFVAGNDAIGGRAFNTSPKMGDVWIPEDVFNMKPLTRNFFENTSTVQLDHRILATATLFSIGGFWWSTRKLDLHPAIRSLIGNTLGMVAVQVTLGISTLLSYVPVSLGAAHQAGALTLLTIMILLNHTLRRPSLHLLKTLPSVVKTS